MIRHALLSLFTTAAPILANTGEPFLFLEPLVLGSPVLITQIDLASESAFSGSGILTGIDALDTPLDPFGEPGRAILYSSEVLFASVAVTPGDALPSGIPMTGAALSFQRWLASDEASAIVPELNLPSETAVLLAGEETTPITDAAPAVIAITGIGVLSFFLRRARRAALPPAAAPLPFVRRRQPGPRPIGVRHRLSS